MRWFQQAWLFGSGKNRMKNRVLPAALLFTYALVTIATSYKKDSVPLESRSYSVFSNCGNATTTSGQVTVTGYEITYPAGTNFTAFGFPTQTMSVGSDVSGELAPALLRTCTHFLNTAVINTIVSEYTCTDVGIPACVINLTHLD